MGCGASRAAVDNYLKERSGTNFGKESDLETVIQNMENNQKSTLTEIIKIEYFEKVEHEELKEAQKWIIANSIALRLFSSLSLKYSSS